MDGLLRNRRLIYVLANAVFATVILLAATQQIAGGATAGYLCALFALCSAPVWLLDRLNGRYLLLAILMALYFVFFGMLDVLTIVLGGESTAGADGISEAEWGILAGAACALAGYCIAAPLPRVVSQSEDAQDWPRRSVLVVGLALWLIGSMSIIYFQVFVIPEKTVAAAQKGLASLGPVKVFFVMLGNLVAPLGLLIIAYGYARFRETLWLLVVLALLLAQVAIAFVTDIRGYALLPIVVVIVAMMLIDNRVPKAWIAGSAIAVALIFPLLSAYRTAVTGEQGLNRAQAVQNLGKVIDIVLAYQDRLQRRGPSAQGASIFERASLKGNVELEFVRVGRDVPFQEGRTLVAVPLAFIPRLIWPDKPDVSTGQLFNHEIIRGEFADTYISPSHMGELYWNYGWPGLLLGMLCIGAILGFVAAKCCLAERASVTRLLVLLATIQYLCWGFEGVISVSYISWMRSLAAIGLLQLLLAKRVSTRSVAAPRDVLCTDSLPSLPAKQPVLPRFPNLLR